MLASRRVVCILARRLVSPFETYHWDTQTINIDIVYFLHFKITYILDKNFVSKRYLTVIGDHVLREKNDEF